MAAERFKLPGAVALLRSGEILVAGGYDARIQLTRETGLYDPGVWNEPATTD